MKQILVSMLAIVMTIVILTGCSSNPSTPVVNTLDTLSKENSQPESHVSSDPVKTAFEIAEDYYNAGDFLKAYSEYSKVPYDDDNYEQAINQMNAAKRAYVQKINDELSNATDEEELQNLESKIDSTAAIFSDDSLYETKAACELKLLEARAKKQLQKDLDSITTDTESKNYSQALEKISAKANSFYEAYGSNVEYKNYTINGDNIELNFSGSSGIADCLNTYFTVYGNLIDNYCDIALSNAESIFSESGDYTKAIQTLNKYLGYVDEFSNFTLSLSNNTLFFNDSDVEAQIEIYRSYVPVLLTDIQPSRSNDIAINALGGWTSGTTDTKTYNQDTDGNIYDSTILNDGGESGGSVTYYLNFKYTNLTGIVYRPYYSISGNGDSDYYNGWVKIYGDGLLLYESPKITKSTYETYRFNVDISGVRELTIQIGGTWYPGWGHLATAGVANATISKTPN